MNEKLKQEIEEWRIHTLDSSRPDTLVHERDLAKRLMCELGIVLTGGSGLLQQKQADPVNHPAHYQMGERHECIDWSQDLGFCLGNAFKYVWRAGSKGDFNQDLDKAVWYVKREASGAGGGQYYSTSLEPIRQVARSPRQFSALALIIDYAVRGGVSRHALEAIEYFREELNNERTRNP